MEHLFYVRAVTELVTVNEQVRHGHVERACQIVERIKSDTSLATQEARQPGRRLAGSRGKFRLIDTTFEHERDKAPPEQFGGCFSSHGAKSSRKSLIGKEF